MNPAIANGGSINGPATIPNQTMSSVRVCSMDTNVCEALLVTLVILQDSGIGVGVGVGPGGYSGLSCTEIVLYVARSNK